MPLTQRPDKSVIHNSSVFFFFNFLIIYLKCLKINYSLLDFDCTIILVKRVCRIFVGVNKMHVLFKKLSIHVRKTGGGQNKIGLIVLHHSSMSGLVRVLSTINGPN